MKKYIPYLILGIIPFIITIIYTESFLLSILSSIAVVIIILLYNPKRRYFRAFWYVISLLASTNLFFIQLIGNLKGISFNFKHEGFNVVQSIALILLAIVLLILDYLERNKNILSKKQINDNNTYQNHYGSGDNVAGDKIIKK